MKICLIAPLPPFRGGIAKYCYSLAQEIEKRHDLLLLSYQRQYPALLYGKKSQRDPEIDPEAIRREFGNLSYSVDSINPLSWRKAVQGIVAFRADFVILPWWVTYFTPMYLYLLRALKIRGIRVIFLCINVYEHESSLLKNLLTEITLKRVDHVVVHSNQERLEVLHINPCALVTKHLLPLFRYQGGRARRQDGTLRLLFFGFVRAYKGLDVLLEAIGMLGDEDISLRIAGEFWEDKERYLEQIATLGISDRVEITDRYLSDREMRVFFEEADLVVLPYLKSKTSGVIATAYGFGKPVLATDVGGFHEVIKDGHTGKVVAAGDPEAIAQGIRWFLKHRNMDFAGNIAEYAALKMSWSSLVRLMESMARGAGDEPPGPQSS